MGSVHTLRSTHPQGWGGWASLACLDRGSVTAANNSSSVMFFALLPSCIPWLGARYALLSYYGCSDFPGAALSTVCPPGKFTAYFANASLPFCPQPPHACDGSFHAVPGFLSYHRYLSTPRGVLRESGHCQIRSRAGFAVRSFARPCIRPNRVHV